MVCKHRINPIGIFENDKKYCTEKRPLVKILKKNVLLCQCFNCHSVSIVEIVGFAGAPCEDVRDLAA